MPFSCRPRSTLKGNQAALGFGKAERPPLGGGSRKQIAQEWGAQPGVTEASLYDPEQAPGFTPPRGRKAQLLSHVSKGCVT